MAAPGTTVTTAIRSGPGSPTVPAAGRAFIFVTTWTGPSGWFPVRSFMEAADIFGVTPLRSTPGGADLAKFFDEGGELAYVGRVLGPAAAAASITLEDGNDPVGDAVTITNLTPGPSNVSVQVIAGTSAGVALVVTETNPTGTVPLPVTLDNLETNAEIKAAVEAHPFLGQYVTVNVDNAGTDPDDLAAIAAATPMTGGDSDINNADVADLMPPADYGAGVILGISLEGLSALAGADALALLRRIRDDRRIMFTTSADASATAAAAGEDISTFTSVVGAALAGEGKTLDEVMAESVELLGSVGAFWPAIGVSISGLAADFPGPVTGAVAGARARAHATEGPHRIPAGEAGILRSVTSVTTTSGPAVVPAEITEAEAAAAHALGLNVVRPIGNDIRVYGYSTLLLLLTEEHGQVFGDNYRLLTERDVVNVAAAEADTIAERYVFRPIDPRGHVFADLRRDLLGLGERLAAAGSLYAKVDPVTRLQVDPGYSVDTGPDVNTPATIAARQINGVLSIRVTPGGETVNITVQKVALSSPI